MSQEYSFGMIFVLFFRFSQQAADDGITNPDGSALDMKERMDPWLNQMGFPLITITRNGDGSATASRSQYLSPANQIMETPSQWK